MLYGEKKKSKIKMGKIGKENGIKNWKGLIFEKRSKNEKNDMSEKILNLYSILYTFYYTYIGILCFFHVIGTALSKSLRLTWK